MLDIITCFFLHTQTKHSRGASQKTDSNGRKVIIVLWLYLQLTPTTQGGEQLDGWHYNAALLTSQPNLTSSPVCPLAVWQFSVTQRPCGGDLSCYSSENHSQPASDHSYTSHGSHFAKTRVPRQGLVVQRATEQPHACYQEGTGLYTRGERRNMTSVLFVRLPTNCR